MYLNDLATALNVARSTIYARLRNAGIQIDTLRTASGELTQEGVTLITSMFDNVSNTQQDTTATQQTSIAIKQAQKDPEKAAVMIATMQGQIDTLTAQLAGTQAQIDLLKESLAKADQRAQETYTQLLRAQAEIDSSRLLAASQGATAAHRPFWQRVKEVFAPSESDKKGGRPDDR